MPLPQLVVRYKPSDSLPAFMDPRLVLIHNGEEIELQAASLSVKFFDHGKIPVIATAEFYVGFEPRTDV